MAFDCRSSSDTASFTEIILLLSPTVLIGGLEEKKSRFETLARMPLYL
jgi:hypothetical protein